MFCTVPAQDLVESFPTDCKEPLTLQGHYRSSIGRTIFRTLSRIRFGAQHVVDWLELYWRVLDKNMSASDNLTISYRRPPCTGTECFIEAHNAVVELHDGVLEVEEALSLKGPAAQTLRKLAGSQAVAVEGFGGFDGTSQPGNLTFIATTPISGTCVNQSRS